MAAKSWAYRKRNKKQNKFSLVPYLILYFFEEMFEPRDVATSSSESTTSISNFHFTYEDFEVFGIIFSYICPDMTLSLIFVSYIWRVRHVLIFENRNSGVGWIRVSQFFLGSNKEYYSRIHTCTFAIDTHTIFFQFLIDFIEIRNMILFTAFFVEIVLQCIRARCF